MNSSPLPLWVSPAEDEPAHGILLRLAERNGIQTQTMMQTLTGLTVSRLRESDGVQVLADIIHSDPSSLLRSTPTVDSQGHLSIRGERIGRKCDVRLSARRLCTQCIGESLHHRFWFDLEFVTTCPRHGLELISSCSCGGHLSWNDVSITRCCHCTSGDVRLLKAVPANCDVVEMDRWALGRLGAGDVIFISALDQMPLKQSIDTIGQIGALDIGGYRQQWVEASDLEVPAVEVRARGFQILKHSRLDGVLDRIYGEFVKSGNRSTPTIHTAYGWFGHWFAFVKPSNFSEEISEIVMANASRKFDVKRKAFHALPYASYQISSAI